MTPAQWNEYQRQADVIEQNEKRKAEQERVKKLAEESWEGCDGCDENDKHFFIKGFQAGYNTAKPDELSDDEKNDEYLLKCLTIFSNKLLESEQSKNDEISMTKEFIPYEEALALKELGFNEPCLGFYRVFSDGDIELLINSNSDMRHLEAPTFSQAFRFFRKKYKLSGTPQYFTGGYYCYTINDMKDTEKSNRLFTEFESYEEAELACIIKLIEIVKNKKD
jgi:hypothetical protein